MSLSIEDEVSMSLNNNMDILHYFKKNVSMITLFVLYNFNWKYYTVFIGSVYFKLILFVLYLIFTLNG